MNRIDLTPLYRNSVGFDRVASLLDVAFRGDQTGSGYPPYDIEVVDENAYSISVAVAGFAENELDIQVENSVLTVRGKKADEKVDRKYLYQGIATRTFERKFNLADHVEVTDAKLDNGLLTINLVREIPEAMKPRSISITSTGKTLSHDESSDKAA